MTGWQRFRHATRTARLGFRRWRRSRPFWGGFWAILGGALIAYGPATAYRFILAAGTTVWLGVLVGVLVAIFGLFLWFAPAQRHLMGILIVLGALVSFVTSDLGGFLVGMLLAMTGGALGFAWVPVAPRFESGRRAAPIGGAAAAPTAE